MRTPHELVMASAGSGKTHRLAARFLGLVARGADPGAILAATFTRAAAGEVLGRVLTRAADAALDDDTRAGLSADIGVELDAPASQALVRRLADNLHRANAITIDSLLARMASVMALELGWPIGWTIADPSGAPDRARLALDDALDDDPDALALARDAVGDAARAVHDRVLRAIAGVSGAASRTRATPGVWEVFAPDSPPPDEPEASTLARELRALTPRVPRTRQGAPHLQYLAGHEALAARVESGDWARVMTSGLVRGARRDGMFANVPIPEALVGLYRRVGARAAAFVLLTFHRRNTALRDLAARVESARWTLARRAREHEFADVARALLAAQGGHELWPVYDRLDARFLHMLLDEYQDTSLDQARLIEPLLEEILSQDAAAGPEGPRTAMIVGDAKQSLYGWRDAEPAIMNDLGERWPGLARVSLALSRRSSPAVIAAVNEVFGAVRMGRVLSGEPGARRWADRFETHATARDDRPGLARLTLVGPERGDSEGRDAALAWAVDRAGELRRQAPLASLAILTRTNAAAARVARLLRGAGLRVSHDGGAPIWESPAVAAALSALRLADHPGSTLSAYHAMTSVFGGALGFGDPPNLSRARAVASRARRRIARNGLASWLESLRAHAVDRLNPRDADRFEALLDLADALDARDDASPGELARLAMRARAEPVRDSGPGPVRVGTVHGAKGLEFDAVILPELHGRWTPGRLEAITDARGLRAPTAACVRPGEAVRAASPLAAELHEHATQRAIEDGLCVLYVAMTRARHVLEMVVPRAHVGGRKRWSAARVLVESLCRDDAPVARDAPAPLARWSTSHGTWIDPTPPLEPSDATPAPAPAIRLDPPTGGDLARAPRRSPSALAHRRVEDAAHALAMPNRESLDLGSAIHAWFQAIEWLDDDARPDAGLAGEALDLARRALAPGAIRDLFRLDAARARLGAGAGIGLVVHREREFAVEAPDPRGGACLLAGRFDRVVVAPDSGRAEVIDFKSDDVARDDARRARAEIYRPQMEAYRLAAAKLFRLDPGRVAARIAWVRHGVVTDVEDRE